MQSETIDLDQMQDAYRAAVEEWIDTIKKEETLAARNQSHLLEQQARKKAKLAKRNYEAALRDKFCNFQ
jgi:hypothetical protein